MIHKHTGRWMWQGSASVVSWSWEKYILSIERQERACPEDCSTARSTARREVRTGKWQKRRCLLWVRSTNGTDVRADTESGLLPRFRNVQIAEYRKMIRTSIMTNGTWAENINLCCRLKCKHRMLLARFVYFCINIGLQDMLKPFTNVNASSQTYDRPHDLNSTQIRPLFRPTMQTVLLYCCRDMEEIRSKQPQMNVVV